MNHLFVVNFLVRRGLGPKWEQKNIEVFLDDIDPETTRSAIIDMAIYEAKEQLRKAGYTSSEYLYQDINSA